MKKRCKEYREFSKIKKEKAVLQQKQFKILREKDEILDYEFAKKLHELDKKEL